MVDEDGDSGLKRPHNPFRITKHEERERHFPPLDGALFQSESFNESGFALSISAQAEIEQHNRRVALYGIEGKDELKKACCDEENQTEEERSSLDRKWEALNFSNVSKEQAYSKNILSTSVGQLDEAIEVMTDQSLSYDAYFRNHSIELLKTPESIRGRSVSPTHRNQQQQHGGSEASTSFTSCDETEIKAMMRLAGYCSPVSKFDITGESVDDVDANENSFENAISLDRVNLSRISAAGSVAASLRNSSHHHHVNNSLLLNQSAISTCSSNAHSSSFHIADKRLFQQQFLSSPLHTSSTSASCMRRSPPRLPPRAWSPRKSDGTKGPTLPKGNGQRGDLHGSPFPTATVAERPIADLQIIRCHFATSPLPPVDPGGNSFLENDGSFLAEENSSKSDSAQQQKKISSLSSITPNTSSSDQIVAFKENGDSNKSIGYTSFGRASPSPTSVIPDSLFAIDDRRRYRTVVPKRVFLSEPSQFPIEDDSFSCTLLEEVHSLPTEKLMFHKERSAHTA